MSIFSNLLFNIASFYALEFQMLTVSKMSSQPGLLSRYSDELRTWLSGLVPGKGKKFRPALESTQPPIQWVPGALSKWVKRPGREAEHPPSSSAEVNNDGDIPPPLAPLWLGA
jgi:hypothetical protein